jgi:transcriptional regulator with XRE-family HTH domain
MDASKPEGVPEPSLDAIHATTTGYFRAMGKRITHLRRSRKMSQAELARLLGIAQQTVFAIECGDRRVRIDLLPVLARTFNVTADELLALKPLPPLQESPMPERLLQHLETLRQLSDGDQRFVLKLAEEMAAR